MMAPEQIIMTVSALFALFLLIFAVNWHYFRDWTVLFLYQGLLDFIWGSPVVSLKLIKYPVRLLPHYYETSILFELWVLPVLCILYNQATRHRGIGSVIGYALAFSAGLTAATAKGGALRTFEAPVSIVNCSFAGNRSPAGGALDLSDYSVDTTAVVANSVFWANAPEAFSLSGPTLAILHSCTQEPALGIGNQALSSDPFLDADGADDIPGTADDDLHLVPGSSCIDAGNVGLLGADPFDLDGDGDTAERLPLDLDGDARVVSGQVDVGAYEAR